MSDKYPPLASNVWIRLEVSFRERCLKRLALVLNVGLCIRTKKVTSEHAKKHIFGYVWCTQVLLPRDGLFLLEGVEEVPEFESCVVLTPSTSPANLFPSLAESTRVREQRDPNQDCKCGLI